MKNWFLTGDKITWTDSFGRAYTRPSLAVFLDRGKQYAVVRSPWQESQPSLGLFLIIDCAEGVRT